MISSLCFQSDTNIEMTAFPVFSMSCEQSEQLIFSVRRPEFQGGARLLFFEAPPRRNSRISRGTLCSQIPRTEPIQNRFEHLVRRQRHSARIHLKVRVCSTWIYSLRLTLTFPPILPAARAAFRSNVRRSTEHFPSSPET